MLDEVLPIVDPELGQLVRAELTAHGVDLVTGTTVRRISRAADQLLVEGTGTFTREVDRVLVIVGALPDTELLVGAGATTGPRGVALVDEAMRTSLPHVFAARDCVITPHPLLGNTYLPLGSTAHKQGRVASENAFGGTDRFAGSLGTQVVKVFDVVAARTGLRDHEALAAGYTPATYQAGPDDHKAYYPGSNPISIRLTGDAITGRLLGAQLVGGRSSEIAKRVDIYATAIHHGMTVKAISELDLSYTPPLGSPWDAVQLAAQMWVRAMKVGE
jgi:NADPH-dependent 2,4-dienoyl-CoA reductase/sulfur reductase-like enzyme